MNEVTVAGFRCFNQEQTVRLAPITVLVGENSTGKTSFLALLRVLWDVALREQLPDFKEPPYDLGSYDEIAHYRGGRGGRAASFEAGFSIDGSRRWHPVYPYAKRPPSVYRVAFRQDDSGVLPGIRRVENGSASAECRVSEDGIVSFTAATSNGRWSVKFGDRTPERRFSTALGWEGPQRELIAFGYLLRLFGLAVQTEPERVEHADGGVRLPDKHDLEAIRHLSTPIPRQAPRPFASAPVRSRPRRTYDPTQLIADPEGEYVPMFLATMRRKDPRAWTALKESIEEFGREAGLFDEIEMKVLGGKTGGPFQFQVRKLGRRSKGPHRNLIDMGYGVSQVLPVVTELLRPAGPRMFLLQQPEVHLHPTAQAALGGLFCQVAARRRRQLIVETHSDHLIDRIRMDIRDRRTKLRPDDVSILYFQRRNLAVTIHSLGWDANGNLVAKRGSIPDGYREFFRTERRRSIGL